MKKVTLLFAIIFLGAISFSACREKKRFQVDNQAIKQQTEMKILRFDSALISLDTANTRAGLRAVAQVFPQIYAHYFDDILEINPADTTLATTLMKELLTDTTYAKVNSDVAEKFRDISLIEKKLTVASAFLKTYFPKIEFPKIYFFVSGCNRSITQHEGFIGIGADFYLGKDYPLYKELTYEYLIQNMSPESIPFDVVSTIITAYFPMKSSKNRLIDNILYQGKILYIVAAALPDDLEENIAGYSTEQLAWCKKYEREIWGAMIEKKHIFSTDFQLIRQYTSDAPFTQPVSQESPGRLGNYIGYQIVKSYMNNNKNVDLQQLAADNDYQQILETSKYKP